MAKTKLTDEVHSTIVSAIEEGNYAKVAAESAGIDESTFYRWMREGETAQSGKMRQFYQSVTRAQGESETTLLSRVSKASKEDWRAATWLLERRFSSRWANTQKIEVAVEKEMEQLIAQMETSLDPDTFKEVMGVLAAPSED